MSPGRGTLPEFSRPPQDVSPPGGSKGVVPRGGSVLQVVQPEGLIHEPCLLLTVNLG